ncbi:MAG TPA: magnesium/cobalt transporter CorA [Cyclobacteriaceae bacterium]
MNNTANIPTEKVILELIQYTPTQYTRYDELPIDELLKQLQPGQVNWINVDCLHEQAMIEKLQTHFNLHTLLVEDIMNDQRPKAEEFDDYLFFTLKMLYKIEGNQIDYEQMSFVLGNNYLISFQEKEGDMFDPFRERIRLDQGKVRKKKADYLFYRLVDIIVDNYYTVLDNIGEQIEDTEEEVHRNPSTETFRKIQAIKKELIYLRKAVYPLRDAVGKIIKDEFNLIEEENLPYFSDVYDHVIHVIDSLETYKDLTASLMDIHINTMNTRMNEVMKVLTIISTIFIPLTFIVGVYGMNFDYMPELHWHYAYYGVWIIMALIVAGMFRYFKYKKWF